MEVLQSYKSSIILILGMVVGGLFGFYFPVHAGYLSPISSLFLNLLYCVVVPMIFVSLVTAIARMSDLKKLAKVLLWIGIITVVTGIISAIFMAVVVTIFNPAQGVQISLKDTVENLTTNSNVLAMFTVDDFNKLFSRRSLMALIVFTLAFGVAVASLAEEKRLKVLNAFEILEEIVMKLVGYVMKLAPIGLFSLFANLIAEQGSAIVGPLSRSVVIYFIAAIVYFIVSTSIYGQIAGGINGVKALWKNIITPSLTSLGTCSSAATIPSNLVAAKAIGIKDEVRDLAIPLGANLHKDGAVMIQILKIAFLCAIFNIDFLRPDILITAILISVLASTVMGAIPAGGYVGEVFIISAFGFPPETIPIMVLIGTITDAPATTINATSDVGMGMLVDRIVNKNKFSEA